MSECSVKWVSDPHPVKWVSDPHPARPQRDLQGSVGLQCAGFVVRMQGDARARVSECVLRGALQTHLLSHPVTSGRPHRRRWVLVTNGRACHEGSWQHLGILGHSSCPLPARQRVPGALHVAPALTPQRAPAEKLLSVFPALYARAECARMYPLAMAPWPRTCTHAPLGTVPPAPTRTSLCCLRLPMRAERVPARRRWPPGAVVHVPRPVRAEGAFPGCPP